MKQHPELYAPLAALSSSQGSECPVIDLLISAGEYRQYLKETS
jgi:hypothetical protein